jgi:hypothetical protein
LISDGSVREEGGRLVDGDSYLSYHRHGYQYEDEHDLSYDVDCNDETIVYDDDDQVYGRIDYNLHPFDDVGDDDDDGCLYDDGQRYLDIDDIHGHDISHERYDAPQLTSHSAAKQPSSNTITVIIKQPSSTNKSSSPQKFQDASSVIDPTIHRSSSYIDPIIRRSPSTIDPAIHRSPSTIDPVIHRSPSTIDPIIHRSPSTIDPSIHRSPSALDSAIYRSPSTIDPTIHRSPSTIDPTIHRSPSAIDPTIHRSPSTIDPTIHRSPSTIDSTVQSSSCKSYSFHCLFPATDGSEDLSSSSTVDTDIEPLAPQNIISNSQQPSPPVIKALVVQSSSPLLSSTSSSSSIAIDHPVDSKSKGLLSASFLAESLHLNDAIDPHQHQHDDNSSVDIPLESSSSSSSSSRSNSSSSS